MLIIFAQLFDIQFGDVIFHHLHLYEVIINVKLCIPLTKYTNFKFGLI
jgi:hypothetical protein